MKSFKPKQNGRASFNPFGIKAELSDKAAAEMRKRELLIKYADAARKNRPSPEDG